MVIDITSLSNITLIPGKSKLLVGVLLSICDNLLTSDCLQFGFKKMRLPQCYYWSIIDYFNVNDSTVFVAALDINKAFDAVNHFKLFFIIN